MSIFWNLLAAGEQYLIRSPRLVGTVVAFGIAALLVSPIIAVAIVLK